MEKRTILAVVLSVVVLWIWAFLVPRPQPQDAQRNAEIKPQPFSQQGVAKEQTPVERVATKETSKEPSEPVDEVTQTIVTERVTVVFSNIGGNIKSLKINKYSHTMPVEKLAGLSSFDDKIFTPSSIANQSIKYTYENSDIKVQKVYNINNDNNLITCSIELHNKSKDSISRKIDFNALTINHSDRETPSNPRDRSLMEYSISHDSGIVRKGNAYTFSRKHVIQDFGMVKWVGFRDRYFCSIVKPEFRTLEYKTELESEDELNIIISPEKETIQPNESTIYTCKILVSPQDVDLLKSYGEGFENIIAYSRFGILNAIARVSAKILKLMHSFIPSWGVCIILMGILVYTALFPLTMKGMYSMKKMQSLQPQMAKLKEQYKNNPQRLNKEIMELYKENKVNPFGGCLPLLLQMPVFIGLYQSLWRNVAFKGTSFLWIKDLSEPDRLFILPTKLPIIGDEINILPVIMAIVMFIQQKITTKNMPSTDPNQATQQRMMTVFFPVFLGFLFYKFASGLALYFTVFYILSIFTQVRMSKMTKAM